SRSGLIFVAARAMHRDFPIHGMDTLLHNSHSPDITIIGLRQFEGPPLYPVCATRYKSDVTDSSTGETPDLSWCHAACPSETPWLPLSPAGSIPCAISTSC